MSQKNYMTYGDAETLFTEIGSKLDEKATKSSVKVFSNKWSTKTWSGISVPLSGYYIWTDGDNIYFSYVSSHYVLNKETLTWSPKTWSGLSGFNGNYIWTDGDNIYYSNGSTQYVLNKETSTWTTNPKGWNGIFGNYIWKDGDNIYYSKGSDQYVLNKENSLWYNKTWSGLSGLDGFDIWKDGDNIYYSKDSNGWHYILNKENSTWTPKSWSGLSDFLGRYIWTDGDNIYYSNGSDQYVLNKETSTWSTKSWSGLSNFDGRYAWTDGDNIYYSNGLDQYALNTDEEEIRFGRDANGNYGYYKVGADTVTPFKNPTGTKSDTYTTNGTRSVDIEDYANHSVTVSVPNTPILKPTSLWTNSSPTSSFSSQTITLSQSIANFNYIKFSWLTYTTDTQDDAHTSSIILLVSDFRKATEVKNVPVPALVDYKTYSMSRRIWYVSDTQIKFSSGARISGSDTDNKSNIPLEISGLKLAVT